MPKKVLAKEPLFNFLDIHVSEIDKHPSALQDMLYNRSFEGMIIRDVLPKDVVDRVVSRLKNNEGDISAIIDSKFADMANGSLSFGENIIFCDPNLQQYFDYPAIFRQKCRMLFEGTLEFEKRVESVFKILSGVEKVEVPSGPQGHKCYIDPDDRTLETSEHRRFIPEGFGIRELSYETPETPLIAVACGGDLYESCCVLRRNIYEITCGWYKWLGQGTEGVDLFTQIALLSEVHFVPQKLYKYRQYPIQATRTTIDFHRQREKVISKWKKGKWLTPEQKSRIDKVLWLFENRLEPFFNMLHGAYLLRTGKLIAGLQLYISSLKKYLLSFLPLPLQNNLSRI